jgi:hypothetical protein
MRRTGLVSSTAVTEVDAMDGMRSRVPRSVQLAVMATPTLSLTEAVAEARRRLGALAASAGGGVAGSNMSVAGAAA